MLLLNRRIVAALLAIGLCCPLEQTPWVHSEVVLNSTPFTVNAVQFPSWVSKLSATHPHLIHRVSRSAERLANLLSQRQRPVLRTHWMTVTLSAGLHLPAWAKWILLAAMTVSFLSASIRPLKKSTVYFYEGDASLLLTNKPLMDEAINQVMRQFPGRLLTAEILTELLGLPFREREHVRQALDRLAEGGLLIVIPGPHPRFGLPGHALRPLSEEKIKDSRIYAILNNVRRPITSRLLLFFLATQHISLARNLQRMSGMLYTQEYETGARIYALKPYQDVLPLDFFRRTATVEATSKADDQITRELVQVINRMIGVDFLRAGLTYQQMKTVMQGAPYTTVEDFQTRVGLTGRSLKPVVIKLNAAWAAGTLIQWEEVRPDIMRILFTYPKDALRGVLNQLTLGRGVGVRFTESRPDSLSLDEDLGVAGFFFGLRDRDAVQLFDQVGAFLSGDIHPSRSPALDAAA